MPTRRATRTLRAAALVAVLAGPALAAAGCAKDDGANIRRPPPTTEPSTPSAR